MVPASRTRRAPLRALRTLAAALTSAVVAVPLALTGATAAKAVEVTPFTQTSQMQVHGNFIVVGNGVLDCPRGTTWANACSSLFDGDATDGTVNDDYVMSYTGAGTGLLNSSQATFTVPQGATVKSARVYWAGNTGYVAGYTGYPACTNQAYAQGAPDGKPETTSVSVTLNGKTKQYLPAGYKTDSGVSGIQSGAPYYYTGSADVLGQFAGFTGNGQPQTITVGNIWTPEGKNCMGGWGLELVYDFGKFLPNAPKDASGNNPSQLRTIYTYDGYARETRGDGGTPIKITGLQPQGNGAQMGSIAYEGDLGISGDTVTYAVDDGSPTAITGPGSQSSADNYFRSYAQGAVPFNSWQKPGRSWYNASVDAATVDLPKLGPTNSRLNINLGTSQDSYLLQNVVVSVPNADVQITKTADNGEQDQAYAPGATPQFRITVYNSGSVAVTQLAVSDAIAPACSQSIAQLGAKIRDAYPTGNGYLPPGGSIQYTCAGPTLSGANAAGYANKADVQGQTGTGIPVSSSDTSRALLGQWNVTKTAKYPDVPAGTAPTWIVTVQNTGTADIFDASVTDAAAPACTQTRKSDDPIKAGSSWTYECQSPATTTGSAAQGATATNTLTATGSARAAQASKVSVPLTADTSKTPATVQGSAVSLTKTADKKTAATGEQVTYTFAIKNTGTSTLNTLQLDDTDFPACNRTISNANLAPGATRTETCTVTEFPTSTTTGVANRAKVTATPPSGTAVSANATATVVDNKALTLSKTPSTQDVNGNGVPDTGDVVTYAFQVANTGSVPLTAVTVSDPRLPNLSCTPVNVAVGASATLSCTRNTYTIATADVDAAVLTNTASASATAPDGTKATTSASASINPVQRPSLALSKTVTPTSFKAPGETLKYTFSLSNDGNTTMSNVTLSDAMSGLSAPVCTKSDGTAATLPLSLAPGATVTCSASYVTQQSDVDAGTVANNATLTGRSPAGTTVTKTAKATAAATQNAHMTLSKTANTPTFSAVGQVVTFTYSAVNDGNVTLRGVSINDPLNRLANRSCTPTQPAVLGPGAKLTCTAQLTVTQADLDAGSITNTATGSGTAPSGAVVTPPNASFVLSPATSPKLTVTKTSNTTSIAAAGDKVSYTIVGTNSGNTTLNNVRLSDTTLGNPTLSCTPAQGSTLAPGAQMRCTVDYTATQKDLDKGVLANQASGTATDSHNAPVTGSGGTSVAVAAAPRLSLTKSASPAQVGAIKDKITYTFAVRNTGNQTVSNVRVNDPLDGLSAVSCTPIAQGGALAPGASTTCTATREATLADFNAGSVSNTASVSGTSPQGTGVQDSSTATVTTTRNPSFTATKTADRTQIDAPGTINYQIVITNDGNVTLSNLAVSDPRIAALTCAPVAATGSLDPGQSTTCSGSYIATQADINAGTIPNTAQVTLAGPGGATITRSPATVVRTTRTPALRATKTATLNTYSRPGDQIGYTVTAENSGNVSLGQVQISDPMFPASSPLSCAWPGANGALDPGQRAICTGTHVVTQADIDAGALTNTATVKGTGPSGAVTQDQASFTATASQLPSLGLTKTAAPTQISAAGQQVTYTLRATNNGNVTLNQVGIADPRFASFSACSPALGSALAPGASMTCTGSYAATQADVDAGSIVNHATATANTPGGTALTPVGADAVVTVQEKAELTLTKTADPARVSSVGQQVTYTFTVRNSGNLTANDIQVRDPRLGASPLSCPQTTLAPNASTTCTGQYKVTQADLDAANATLHNDATVDATDPHGRAFPQAKAGADVAVAQNAQLAITKDANKTSVATVGETLGYTIAVRNAGNVTVTNVRPADALLKDMACTPALGSSLAPGATMTCTGTYAVTQGNLDQGVVANEATADGVGPDGKALPTVSVRKDVSAQQTSQLTLKKTADRARVSAVGDVVTYSYAVTNTGNITLGSLVINDNKPGLSAISCDATSLRPGQSTTCRATYPATQADLNAGSLTNTATATARGPLSKPDPVSATDSTVVQVEQKPALTLTKTASQPDYGTLGRVVTYTYVARNDGNVSIDNVAIADPMQRLSALSCPSGQPARLNPGDALTCAATYTITQADLDALSVTNTATASGTANGQPITNAASLTLRARPAPALNLTKQADPASVTSAGQQVTYAFTVSNTGNVSLHDVAIADPLAGLSAPVCEQTTIAPGQTTRCTAGYTVTQADVDRGSISNTATASGTDPAGTVATQRASTTVQAPQSPKLTVAKSVAPATYAAPGDVLTYTYRVTNAGNVTMTGVAIRDVHPDLRDLTCPVTELAPGASTDCTARYAVTLADLNAGSIVDTATASATGPTGQAVTSDPSTATATATQNPTRTFRKTASPATVTKVGDQVTYTLSTTNTGNVTLGGVYIADPPLQSGTNWSCTITAPGGATRPGAGPVALDPGETKTCTATYTATQADFDAGSIVNNATLYSNDAAGKALDTMAASATVVATQAPELTFTKTSDTGSYRTVGQTVTYTFTATNSGNTTLSNVQLSDPHQGLSTPTCTPALGSALAPKATMRCTATYVVTQADIDARSLSNTATLTAQPPSGAALTRTANLVIPASLSSSIDLGKAATPASVDHAGQELTYTFTVTNTGNSTLTNIAVSDPHPGLSAISCPVTTLAPKASTTCTATYTATQDDIDAARIDNQATVSATDPAGTSVTHTASTVAQVSQAPALSLTKTPSVTSVSKDGDRLDFTFVVTNTGNTTVNDIVLSDPYLDATRPMDCPQTTLAPGAQMTCVTQGEADQQDIDNGGINNRATVTGTTTAKTPVTPGVAEAHVSAEQRSSMRLTKSAAKQSVSKIGDSVEYSLDLENTGNTTLSDVYITDLEISDPATGLMSCVVQHTDGKETDASGLVALTPGEHKICTGTRTFQQADFSTPDPDPATPGIDWVNTATATANDPSGKAVEQQVARATVQLFPSPDFQVTKTANTNSYSYVGQKITYTVAARNTGNVALSNVQVVDQMLAGVEWACSPALGSTLQPNQSMSCNATYTITQDDINVGSLTNRAYGRGTDPQGVSHDSSKPGEFALRVPTDSADMTLTKLASPGAVSAAGDKVEYSFVVHNGGGVDLVNLQVTDALSGLSAISCPTTVVPRGGDVTCTASYTATQADIDNHGISNSATATANAGAAEITRTATARVAAAYAPAISMTKSAQATSADGAPKQAVDTVGDVIRYSFVVRNDGNVPLTQIVLADRMNLTGLSCPTTTLAPGASTTCTATHTVTQDELNRKAITNNATVTASDSDGTQVQAQASASVATAQNPGVQVSKSVTPATATAAGQLATYTVDAVNTGNVTLYQTDVADPLKGLSKFSCKILSTATGDDLRDGTGPVALNPGETKRCSATYVLTQADVDAGAVNNTATVTTRMADGSAGPSDSKSAVVAVTAAPALTVQKSVDTKTYTRVGQALNYTVTVTNTGNVTAYNVQPNDTLTQGAAGSALPALENLTCTPAAGSALAPNASLTCTGRHTVTQSDLDAGSVANAATASANTAADGSGTAIAGNTVQVSSQASTQLGLGIFKSADAQTFDHAGQVITYSFLVTNTGTATLDQLAVTDTFTNATEANPIGSTEPLAVTCPAGPLAPGAQATCTARYTVQQSDLDNARPAAGYGLVNDATATAQDAAGRTTSATDRLVLQGAPAASLSLAKSADPTTVDSVGQSVAYRFAIANNGNVRVDNIALTDPLAGLQGLTCPATSLEPGQTMTCTASLPVTQETLDAGSFSNTASLAGQAPDGTPIAVQHSTAKVEVAARPSLSLTKRADTTSITRVGQEITYTVDAVNTGNITLNNVFVADPLQQSGMSKFACTITANDGSTRNGTGPVSLAPGERKSCQATYAATQADLDAGSLTNTASVTATGAGNAPLPATPSNPVVIAAEQRSSLAVTKVAKDTQYNRVGQQLGYQITVTNTGNTSVANVQVTDKLPVTDLSCTPQIGSTLAAGQSMSCTASYTATQADLDALSITNTANASGTALGASVTAASNDAVSTAVLAPSLTLFKRPSVDAVTAAGQRIRYTFEIENTGNATLTGASITDEMPGLSAPDCGGVTSIAPKQTIECTADYTVTQKDVDDARPQQQRGINNTATVSATDPSQATVTATRSAVVQVTPQPKLSVTKTADVASVAAPGDRVTFTITTRNEGNVSLNGLAITDSLPGIEALQCPSDPSTVTLAPQQSFTCTAAYATRQSDIDTGAIANTAAATATAPDGTAAQAQGAVSVPATQSPAMTLQKAVSSTTFNRVGQTLTYTLTMRNSGNTTLSSVFVADPLQQTSVRPLNPMSRFRCEIVAVDGTRRPGSGPVTVAPGEQKICTATMLTTQDDLDAGSIPNTATVVANRPNGEAIGTVASNPVVVTAAQKKSITLSKKATSARPQQPGDPIDYTFVVTNTGTVTLHDVTLTDPAPGLSGLTCDAPLATLAPGAQVSCTAEKKVTADELNQPRLPNTATVTATAPQGDAVTSQGSAEIIPVHRPELTLDKSAPNARVTKAGDTVEYLFRVTNVGNIAVDQIGIDDALLTAPATCAAARLNPGEATTCRGSYVVTQADVDRGRIDNTATTRGGDPVGGDPVDQDTSSVQVPIAQTPSLAITKKADAATPLSVGQATTFTVTATNTGNVTATGVQVSDAMPSVTGLTCTPAQPATLAPGATMTCSVAATATQADMDARTLLNTASVNGVDPNGSPIYAAANAPQASASQPMAEGTVSATLTKTADKDQVTSVGETIRYTMTATNTGSYSLAAPTITDAKDNLTDVECDRAADQGPLAPGEKLTCSATYYVTQADLNNGHISNTATFTGTSPNWPNNGGVYSTEATRDVAATQSPALVLTKTADRRTVSGVNDTISYAFNVRNTGNVAVELVTINDNLPGLGALACTGPDGQPLTLPASLAPQASLNCTASGNPTQDMLDAGSVVNTATVTGQTGLGQPVSSPSSSSVTTVERDPKATLTKTADTTLVQKVGDRVTYTLTATNRGNQTLSGAQISDPLLPSLTCTPAAPATLAPQATMTCTGTHEVTHADLEAGRVNNTATFHGQDLAGTPVTTSASLAINALYNPRLQFIKQVSSTPVTTSNASFPATPARWVAGDTITYTYHVANVGNMQAFHVIGVDTMADLSTLRCYAPKIETNAQGEVTGVVAFGGREVVMGSEPMQPGQYVDCVATYPARQIDVNRGYVSNTATLTGQEATGQAFPTEVSSATARTDQEPSISVTKAADVPSGAQIGDAVNYRFTVTNTSKVTVNSTAISDGLAGLPAVDCPNGALQPGASQVCTARYSVTQADLDRGFVDNVATAGARDTRGTRVSATSNELRTPLRQRAELSLEKSGPGAAVTRAGEHVAFTVTATNSGNVTATEVAISERNAGGRIESCDRDQPATLAPGETLTCRVDYVVGQDEIDAGLVHNVADVNGRTPQGAAIATATASKDVAAQRSPAITLAKTPSVSRVSEIGQQVRYTMTAVNTGNTTLDDVQLEDPLPGLGALSCTPSLPATLAPGERLECSADYATTLADMNAGAVRNTASVSAVQRGGSRDVPGDVVGDSEAAEVTVDRRPALSLTKSADRDESNAVSSLSDPVTYTFVVRNTGNETVHDISVEDPLTAAGLTPVACPRDTLDPGQEMTCTADYRPTQSDLDRGYIPNTATPIGIDVVGTRAAATPGTVRVPAEQTPSYQLTKTADHSAFASAGEWILYTFVGRNTGNVTLHVVRVGDPLPGLVKPDPANLNTPGTEPGLDCYPRLPADLPPGDQVLCRAYYRTTDADVARGSINNTATMTGEDPLGNALPPTSATRTLPRADMQVTKRVSDPSIQAVTAAGQKIPYEITVTNSGGAALRPVTLSDPMFADAGALSCRFSDGTPADLAGEIGLDGTSARADGHGSTLTCTGTHEVTQAELDGSGAFVVADGTQLRNPVEVSATPVQSADGATAATIVQTAEAVVPIKASPQLTLSKSADVAEVRRVGDPVTFTITATNSGNVTLRDVTLRDELPGLGELSCAGQQPGASLELAPGASVTCTAPYAITQADLDRGSVVNVVTGSAIAPASAGRIVVRDSAPARAEVKAQQTVAAALTKSVTPTDGARVGDTLRYAFTLTNTGSVTSALELRDPLPGLSVPQCEQPTDAVAPGVSVTCSASYVVTQADVDAGAIANQATLTARGPQGTQPVEVTAGAVARATQTASIALTKTAQLDDANGNGAADAGEEIGYTLTARNNGTLTLTDAVITDPMLGTLTCTTPQPARLAPDAVLVCTGRHTVSADEARSGAVHNTASVAALAQGATVTASAEATTAATVPATPTPTPQPTAAPGTKQPTPIPGRPQPTPIPGPPGSGTVPVDSHANVDVPVSKPVGHLANTGATLPAIALWCAVGTLVAGMMILRRRPTEENPE